MGICKEYIRTKDWYDRTDCVHERSPITSTFERWNSRTEELETQSMNNHLETFGQSALKQEQREIAFLRKIYYQHGKVRSSTVEKIIANRTKYMDAIDSQYQPKNTRCPTVQVNGKTISVALHSLLTECDMSIQAWIESMNEWQPDLKKLEKEAVAYFKSRLQLEKNFDDSVKSYMNKSL